MELLFRFSDFSFIFGRYAAEEINKTFKMNYNIDYLNDLVYYTSNETLEDLIKEDCNLFYDLVNNAFYQCDSYKEKEEAYEEAVAIFGDSIFDHCCDLGIFNNIRSRSDLKEAFGAVGIEAHGFDWYNLSLEQQTKIINIIYFKAFIENIFNESKLLLKYKSAEELLEHSILIISKIDVFNFVQKCPDADLEAVYKYIESKF